MRTAAFVDAGYLYAAGSKLLSGTNLPRNPVQLDIDAVLAALREAVAAVSPSSSLLRVYWYDGVLRTGPTAEREKLADADGVKLRLGMIVFTGRQKGVDSLIVTDLIELARNHRSRTRFYCRATKTCASVCKSRRALVCVSTSWGSVPTTNHASSAKSRTRQVNGSDPKSRSGRRSSKPQSDRRIANPPAGASFRHQSVYPRTLGRRPTPARWTETPRFDTARPGSRTTGLRGQRIGPLSAVR